MNLTYRIGGDQYQGGGSRAIYLKINDASAVLSLVFDKKTGEYEHHEIYEKEYILQNKKREKIVCV